MSYTYTATYLNYNKVISTVEYSIEKDDFSYFFEPDKDNVNYSIIALSDMNTRIGINFEGMFNNCVNLTGINCNLDTSYGLNFRYMFNNCKQLTHIEHFNTHNGADFYKMFANCRSLVTAPELDISNVGLSTTLFYMFYNCINLTSIPNSIMNTIKSKFPTALSINGRMVM